MKIVHINSEKKDKQEAARRLAELLVKKYRAKAKKKNKRA